MLLRDLKRIIHEAEEPNAAATETSQTPTIEKTLNNVITFNGLFIFLYCRLTTEAMGIWRFAGAFAVVKRQSECGSKTAGMHVSQPMNIGVC